MGQHRVRNAVIVTGPPTLAVDQQFSESEELHASTMLFDWHLRGVEVSAIN